MPAWIWFQRIGQRRTIRRWAGELSASKRRRDCRGLFGSRPFVIACHPCYMCIRLTFNSATIYFEGGIFCLFARFPSPHRVVTKPFSLRKKEKEIWLIVLTRGCVCMCFVFASFLSLFSLFLIWNEVWMHCGRLTRVEAERERTKKKKIVALSLPIIYFSKSGQRRAWQ